MSKLHRWILQQIAKRTVRQGALHQYNIIEFYCILVAAARNEFVEDNKVTLNSFLTKCHEEALMLK